jgi:hypothetical protein
MTRRYRCVVASGGRGIPAPRPLRLPCHASPPVEGRSRKWTVATKRPRFTAEALCFSGAECPLRAPCLSPRRFPPPFLNAVFKLHSCKMVSCHRGRHRSRRRIGFMYRKLLSAASTAFLLSVFCVDGASAAGGCGPGFHRGPYGACRPNGPVVVAPVVVAPAVVAPGPVVCGVGFRWHPRLRHCVVL